jgi:hypothetical protein
MADFAALADEFLRITTEAVFRVATTSRLHDSVFVDRVTSWVSDAASAGSDRSAI